MGYISRSCAAIGIAALALSLAACSGSGALGTPVDPASPTDDTGAGTAGSGGADCFSGTWSADIPDLARQLGEQFAGLTVESTSGEGTQRLEITGGTAEVSTDVVFTIVLAVDDGLSLRVVQHHQGLMSADWAWDGDEDAGTVEFSDYTASDYQVDTSVSINGVASDSSYPIDTTTMTTTPMRITCSGDTMTTSQDMIPFTTTWHRTG